MPLFILLLFLGPQLLLAQRTELPVFEGICRTHKISFPDYQDSTLKFSEGVERFNRKFDLRIADRKAKYCVLAYFEPLELTKQQDPPAVVSILRASHFATNDTASVIAAHTLDLDLVKAKYGADWGKVFYFKPKNGIENYKECQFVALHKDGKGTFYLLYFFDKFSSSVEEMIWNPTFKEDEG